MHFSASYDRTTRIVSAIVCGGLFLLAAAVQSWIVAVLAAAVLLGAYAFSPRGYTVSGDSILIHRLIGEVRIPVRELRAVRRATSDDFQGGIRLFGSGGLFGYFGLFRTARLGKSHWYVTNRSNAVIIRTEDRTVVVSPDDPDGFLRTIHPPSQPVGGDPVFTDADGLSDWVGRLLAGVIAAGAVVVVFIAMTYAPGPDPYTLTRQTLTIHDRFYPVTLQADAVDVSGIRIVDLAADPQWRPTLRTNGFSNSHYHSGWYRVASGQKVRLYRTTGEKLVLLPPKGTGVPVLYQPAAPERFLAEVRRQWAGS